MVNNCEKRGGQIINAREDFANSCVRTYFIMHGQIVMSDSVTCDHIRDSLSLGE